MPGQQPKNVLLQVVFSSIRAGLTLLVETQRRLGPEGVIPGLPKAGQSEKSAYFCLHGTTPNKPVDFNPLLLELVRLSYFFLIKKASWSLTLLSHQIATLKEGSVVTEKLPLINWIVMLNLKAMMLCLIWLVALMLNIVSHRLLCGCKTEIYFHCFDLAILYVDKKTSTGAPNGLKWVLCTPVEFDFSTKEILSDT